MKQVAIGLMILSGLLMQQACKSDEPKINPDDTGGVSSKNTSNSNSTQTVSTTMPSIEAPDSSEITTTIDAGVKRETRTFKNNPNISKVIVTTRNGKRTAKVYSTNGEARDLPEDEVERALDNTGDAIAEAAGFVQDKTKDVASTNEEGGEKVIDKTKEGTEKVVDKTKEGAKTVADKTVDGVKKVGQKTVEGAKKVKDKLTP